MGNGFVIGKHPEMKDTEWLFSNVKIGEEWLFGCFDGKCKNGGRFGKVAYNKLGYVIAGYRPLFIKRKKL